MRKGTFKFGTSIISIDRYFVNASEVAIPSCMNGPISFLHTPERKERPAGRPISLVIACSFPWSLLTPRRGIFVPLDRKFHVPKDHQHHYQRSHHRVALASIISVRRLIRETSLKGGPLSAALSAHRIAHTAPCHCSTERQSFISWGSLFDSLTSPTHETNVLPTIATRIHRRRNN